jgi:Zn-dependent protease
MVIVLHPGVVQMGILLLMWAGLHIIEGAKPGHRKSVKGLMSENTMRYTLKIGSYFGIPVRVHITFPLILIVFGFEAGIKGGVGAALWAILLVLAVFTCVVLHEFGHSLQARRYGIRVRDIILLPIGGMARAEQLPEKPWQEIVVAISGPLVNFVLAAILFGLILLRGKSFDFENDFLTVLFSINVVLGIFNLIPAFPMDGGRILRGLLALKLSYLSATHHAKSVGQAIAIIFVIIGFVNTNFIMLPIIAVFIFFGAISEENMIKMKINLEGKTTKDFIPEGIPILSTEATVESAAPWLKDEDVSALPVTDAERRMSAAALRCDLLEALTGGRHHDPLLNYIRTDFPLVDCSTSAVQAYYFMRSGKYELAGVMEHGSFIGLISFSDLSRAIS